MLRLLGIAALALTALFALALAGLHAQSQPPQRQASLGDCSMPCWEGVHPGVTMRTDALALLKSLGWRLTADCNAAVYDACYEYTRANSGLIAYLYVAADQVKEIALINPGLTLGDVWLTFGSPDTAAISPRKYREAALNSAFWFGGSDLSTRMTSPCPSNFADVLRAPVSVILVWEPGTTMDGTTFDNTTDLRLAIHQVCG